MFRTREFLSKIAGSASLLVMSGIFAQALQFLGTLYLVRVYSPDAYGYFTLVINWASVCAVACSLQLHTALHVARSDERAREIMAAAIYIVPLVALPSAVVCFYFGQHLLTLAFILGGALAFSNIGRSALARKSENVTISGLTIGRAAAAIAAQVSLRSVGGLGLILGLVIAETIAALAFIGFSLRREKPFRKVKIFKVIRQLRNFTLWGALQETVSIGVVLLPFLICSIIYDTDVVGHYAVAYRILWAPAVILSFGFGLVFLTELSRSSSRFWEVLDEVHYRELALLAILISLSTPWWLPHVFRVIVGSNWDIAASMSPPVAIAAASFLISAPFRQLYRVLEKQIIQLSVDASVIMLLVMTWLMHDAEPVAWVYVVCGIFVMQNMLLIGLTRIFHKA